MRMPRTGVTPSTARRVLRALIMLYNKYINSYMKLFFAGATHAGQIHVREQIRVTLKTPYGILLMCQLVSPSSSDRSLLCECCYSTSCRLKSVTHCNNTFEYTSHYFHINYCKSGLFKPPFGLLVFFYNIPGSKILVLFYPFVPETRRA
jgi:hypothetical protein